MPKPSQPRFLHTPGAAYTLHGISLFLILSLLMCPHIHLNILISTTLIFWTWNSWLPTLCLIQHSQPNQHFIGFILSLGGTFRSHKIPETSFNFTHPTPVRCVYIIIDLSITLIENPRYMEYYLLGMTYASSLTSMLTSCVASLNLNSRIQSWS